jgi:hypothetical protein
MIISFYFGKFTEMIGYPIGFMVRQEIKNHGISNKFHNQFRGSQTSKILESKMNYLFPAPNDGSQTSCLAENPFVSFLTFEVRDL